MTAESEEFASGGPFDFGKDGWANSLKQALSLSFDCVVDSVFVSSQNS